MSCESVRNAVAAGRGATELRQSEHEPHLRSCSACADLVEGLATAEELRSAWQDEAVPAWERPRLPHRQPKPWMTTWLPLAACLVMGLLVVARAEISVDDRGWHFSFGGAAREQALLETVRTVAAEERANSQKRLTELLDQYDARQRSATEALLSEFGTRQQAATENQVALATQTVREDQVKSMKTLIGAIQDQREQDMLWVQQRLENVALRQERTHSNLNRLASYVTREDAR